MKNKFKNMVIGGAPNKGVESDETSKADASKFVIENSTEQRDAENKEIADKLAQEKEYQFFDPDTQGIDSLILLSNQLYELETDSKELFIFINKFLKKEFNGSCSVFLFNEDKDILVNGYNEEELITTVADFDIKTKKRLELIRQKVKSVESVRVKKEQEEADRLKRVEEDSPENQAPIATTSTDSKEPENDEIVTSKTDTFEFPPNKVDSSKMNPTELYSGHREDGFFQYQISEFDNYIFQYAKSITETKLPTWSDPTFQEPILQFIYPYFDNEVYLGFSVCHFKDSIKTREQTKKVELIMMSTKGIMVEEFLNPKKASKV